MRPSAIEPWFRRFVEEHVIRHPRAGLPAFESKEGEVVYSTWRKLLARIEGIDYLSATAASERLVAEPASERKHFTALAAFAAEAILARKPEGKRNDLTTRDGAEQASKGCGRCGGTGLVSVFRRPPVPERTPASVAAHCVCALGRWMRRYWEAKDPAIARRFVDLAEVLNGRSAWTADEPSPVKHYEEPPTF